MKNFENDKKNSEKQKNVKKASLQVGFDFYRQWQVNQRFAV